MKDAERWPFIAPYCKRMGSFPYYLGEQYAEARAIDAPRDTYALSGGDTLYRVPDCDDYTRARHERDAGVTVESVLK